MFRQQSTRIDKLTGKRIRRKSKLWYAKVKLADDTFEVFPLARNKAAAALVLAEIQLRIEDERRGILNPSRAAASKPLADHIADWEADIRNGGADPAHARTMAFRVSWIAEQRGWKRLADVTGDSLRAGLALLREGRDAAGNRLRGGSQSEKTVSYYQRECKAFCSWCVANHRLAHSPLSHLAAIQVVTLDRVRRALAVAEIEQLLAAASASAATIHGLDGRTRRMLYLVALSTGFRIGEIATLTCGDLSLATSPATLTLRSRDAKNSKAVRQPLPSFAAAEIAAHVAGQPPGALVFPVGPWSVEGSELLQVDLAAAGIAYVVDGPSGPLYADFHALRHTYIQQLVDAGIDVKTVQALARHSSITLTLDLYTRPSELRKSQAVGVLDFGAHTRGHTPGSRPAMEGGGT